MRLFFIENSINILINILGIGTIKILIKLNSRGREASLHQRVSLPNIYCLEKEQRNYILPGCPETSVLKSEVLDAIINSGVKFSKKSKVSKHELFWLNHDIIRSGLNRS